MGTIRAALEEAKPSAKAEQKADESRREEEHWEYLTKLFKKCNDPAPQILNQVGVR